MKIAKLPVSKSDKFTGNVFEPLGYIVDMVGLGINPVKVKVLIDAFDTLL